MTRKIMLFAMLVISACNSKVKEPEFWLGADIGWCTEYEAKGYKFYNRGSREIDLKTQPIDCQYNKYFVS